MKRVVVWQRTDTFGLEVAEIDGPPLRLEGDVVLVEDGEPLAVAYRVECDDEAKTRRAVVRAKRRGMLQECALERGPGDRWTWNGAPMPLLDGLVDVDLSITPSTNTPPFRRLRLAAGQRAEITAAWVSFPTLDVAPLRQVVRRVGLHAYEYEAPELGFAAEIECDEEGIVRSYGELWKRVA
jgi:hypothetical protein